MCTFATNIFFTQQTKMTKKVFLVMGFVLIPYVTASLIEQGTHDQLLQQKGKYYQLYTGKEI